MYIVNKKIELEINLLEIKYVPRSKDFQLNNETVVGRCLISILFDEFYTKVLNVFIEFAN